MASRRNFLKASGATFALASLGSLAGCTQLETITGPSAPAYSSWLYDPETVLNVDNHLFASVNIQSYYEHEDQLPEELFDSLDQLDEEIDSVELDELQHMTMLAYGETDFSRAGMSWVVSGSFDSKEISEEIENELEKSQSGENVEKGEYEGYTLYSIEQPYGYSMSGESDSTMSMTFAIGDENALLGMVVDADARAKAAVEQMIESDAGTVERYYDTNENAKTMMQELGDATVAMGLNLEVSILKDWVPDEETEIKAVLDDLEAMGMGATINGETTENKIILVYEDEDAASAENVEALIERLKEESEEFEENTTEITVSADGRAVVVTSEVDTDELWSDYQDSSGGLMGTGTGSSSTSFSSDASAEAPQVSLSFEQNTDGTVTITHRGGDHVTDTLYIEYVDDEGYDQFEFWVPEGGAIAAGDSYTTTYALSADTRLSVLWTGPNGSSFETLGAFSAY
ncbi:twin-arginine translocation signal domain-containing protein [Haladaptatus sp. CMSO5]|uniref:twin-arginine translocation signal domain-containing protein n=1 Tax=Haladaptatus sp. CMSO5 TaxID=3120514 RepID=UPI002FCE14E1